MDLLKTTGSRPLDAELDRMLARIAALESALTLLKAPAAPAPAAAVTVTSASGVSSLAPSGGRAITGDVTLAGAGALAIAQSNHTLTLTVGLAAAVQPVGSAGVVGISTNAAREDHAHAGLHSLNNLLGDVSIVSAGGCTVSVVGQQVRISVP